MILITFTFLGKKVKMQTETSSTGPMNDEYKDNPKLAELVQLNDVLLVKNSAKFKDAYEWCNTHKTHKSKRKGRETIFAF